MPENNLLSAVNGYREACDIKLQLEESGSDFYELKGNVTKVISQLHPKRLSLTVTEVIEETVSTKTLRLASSRGAKLPPFQAGQYINLFVEIDGVHTARPYAISSSPSQRDYYDLTVKRLKGGFVSEYLLDQVKLGLNLISTGPMGTFYHSPLYHGDDLVFLAGGSGGAPARSILLDILNRGLPYNFHMIYVNSFADDVIYAQELRALQESFDNFFLTEVITRPSVDYVGYSGRLSHELLEGKLGRLDKKMFYVCGPTPFNENCLKLLTGLGVERQRIRVEVNGAPKAPNSQSGWPDGVALEDEVTVRVKGKGSFTVKVGEPLLNSLERNGYSTENACRSGECSLCRVKLLSGSVFNPQEARLRKSDRDFNWIYSCVAFPTEDVEIQL